MPTSPTPPSRTVRRLNCLAVVLIGGLPLLVTTRVHAETAADLCEAAARASQAGQREEAIKLLDRAIESSPDYAFAYYLRGRERFRLGLVRESVADFDQYVRRDPARESRQWERGIALYYAGEYERGAKQFELYQTFESNDVENAVWRYLCVAKQQSAEVARGNLLPIDNDRRVPMMQVYEMYRGKLTPEDVLKAAAQGDPPPEVLAGRLFYAHLYLGLYYESLGKADLARKYVQLAADEKLATNPRLNSYMWDVARVHAGLLDAKPKPAQTKTP